MSPEKKLHMPGKWMIWLLTPMCVALAFLLLHFLAGLPWESQNAPAWVQAVGSVLALGGAIWLPIAHERKSTRAREQRTLTQLRAVADDCYERMWELSLLFIEGGRDGDQIRSYLRYGKEKDWPLIQAAVRAFPITEVPAGHIKTLLVLQQAAEQAVFVIGLLDKWLREGNSHPEIVIALRACRDHLGLLMNSLPGEKASRCSRHYQEKGARLENLYLQLNPMDIDGAKVYRRYPIHEPGTAPTHVDYQVIFPFDDESFPFERHLEKDLPPGWTSFADAENAVRSDAKMYIGMVAGQIFE